MRVGEFPFSTKQGYALAVVDVRILILDGALVAKAGARIPTETHIHVDDAAFVGIVDVTGGADAVATGVRIHALTHARLGDGIPGYTSRAVYTSRVFLTKFNIAGTIHNVVGCGGYLAIEDYAAAVAGSASGVFCICPHCAVQGDAYSIR